MKNSTDYIFVLNRLLTENLDQEKNGVDESELAEAIKAFAQNSPSKLFELFGYNLTLLERSTEILKESIYFAEWSLCNSILDLYRPKIRPEEKQSTKSGWKIQNWINQIDAKIENLPLTSTDLSVLRNLSKYFKELEHPQSVDFSQILAILGIETKKETDVYLKDIGFNNRFIKLTMHFIFNLSTYFLDFCRTKSFGEFIEFCIENYSALPRYLIMSDLSYPMGGGESYMMQTAEELSESNFDCYWISSRHAANGIYFETKFRNFSDVILIDLKGGISESSYLATILEISPDVIHSHGSTNRIASSIALKLRIPALIGFHFWSDLVKLGLTYNQDILSNLPNHKLDDSWMIESPLITYYAASEFMIDVYRKLGGKHNLETIYPISRIETIVTEEKREFVLQANICKLKGGEIFEYCVNTLGGDINFKGVLSEPDDLSFYDSLYEAVRNKPDSEILPYGNIFEYFSKAKLVLIPTQVDETFCRVAYEAIMSGVPVIATKKGFLPSMLGESGHFLPQESEAWAAAIESLVESPEKLANLLARQRSYIRSRFEGSEKKFRTCINQIIEQSQRRNIGIFSLWLDQGMGIGSKHYSRILRGLGLSTHIFSFEPYSKDGVPLSSQFDSSEWEIPKYADSITHINKIREQVLASEIDDFIRDKNLGYFWQTEICWSENWKRLANLKERVRIISIPCIEIVRKSELESHLTVDVNFCVTRYTEEELNLHGVTNTYQIGHGLKDFFGSRLSSDHESLRYLHLAGYNPKTRKKTTEIIESFAAATNQRKDIYLTVLSNEYIAEYEPYLAHPQIHFGLKRFSYEEIQNQYLLHDVTIHLSSHEGLGLGLYESIAAGTPVITHSGLPHSEAIKAGETGWIVQAKKVPMPDNDEAIVGAWDFDKKELSELLVQLNRSEVNNLTQNIPNYFKNNFNESDFALRVFTGLNKVGSNPHRKKPAYSKVKAPFSIRVWVKKHKIIYKLAYPSWKLFIQIRLIILKIEGFLKGN